MSEDSQLRLAPTAQALASRASRPRFPQNAAVGSGNGLPSRWSRTPGVGIAIASRPMTPGTFKTGSVAALLAHFRAVPQFVWRRGVSLVWCRFSMKSAQVLRMSADFSRNQANLDVALVSARYQASSGDTLCLLERLSFQGGSNLGDPLLEFAWSLFAFGQCSVA